MPKSLTFTAHDHDTSTLCGEMSRWTRPRMPSAPAGKSWAETVVITPEGGYRMGNPDAPIKIVEFASLTCSHCAEFAEAASASLRLRNVFNETHVRSTYGASQWILGDPRSVEASIHVAF